MLRGIGFKRQRLLIFYRTKVLYAEIYNHFFITDILKSQSYTIILKKQYFIG